MHGQSPTHNRNPHCFGGSRNVGDLRSGRGAALISPRPRHIGTIGTTARVAIGLLLLLYGLVGGRVQVMHGEVQTGFDPPSVAIGAIAFPAVLLAWQWLRARSSPSRYEETGPLGTTINIIVFIALVLTPLYARPLSFTSNAALVFYGASMLLAAARGYSGCEVLALSNWILRRDDQVGCLLLSPVDNFERGLRSTPVRPQ